MSAAESPCHRWLFDYEGHRLVNQLALAALPEDFPPFVRTAAARADRFSRRRADRWRNSNELPLQHVNGPDHFIDFEDLTLFELDARSVRPFRYEFVAQLARARAAAERFPAIDPARNLDQTRQFMGFLPWTITGALRQAEVRFLLLEGV